jgi:hypothetical protein
VVEFEIPGEALRASGCSLFEGWKRDIGEGTGNIAVLNGLATPLFWARLVASDTVCLRIITKLCVD